MCSSSRSHVTWATSAASLSISLKSRVMDQMSRAYWSTSRCHARWSPPAARRTSPVVSRAATSCSGSAARSDAAAGSSAAAGSGAAAGPGIAVTVPPPSGPAVRCRRLPGQLAERVAGCSVSRPSQRWRAAVWPITRSPLVVAFPTARAPTLAWPRQLTCEERTIPARTIKTPSGAERLSRPGQRLPAGPGGTAVQQLRRGNRSAAALEEQRLERCPPLVGDLIGPLLRRQRGGLNVDRPREAAAQPQPGPGVLRGHGDQGHRRPAVLPGEAPDELGL